MVALVVVAAAAVCVRACIRIIMQVTDLYDVENVYGDYATDLGTPMCYLSGTTSFTDPEGFVESKSSQLFASSVGCSLDFALQC